MSQCVQVMDRIVGARIRMRRKTLGMSLKVLARSVGISFQQLQKYEIGINRIGASRLQQIADVLEVPVGSFFETAARGDERNEQAERDDLRRAHLLVDAFVRLPEQSRQSVMRLLLSIENAGRTVP